MEGYSRIILGSGFDETSWKGGGVLLAEEISNFLSWNQAGSPSKVASQEQPKEKETEKAGGGGWCGGEGDILDPLPKF
jgi:hypothetical protein